MRMSIRALKRNPGAFGFSAVRGRVRGLRLQESVSFGVCICFFQAPLQLEVRDSVLLE